MPAILQITQSETIKFVQYFTRKILTYLQKYAIIISEQGKQKTLEDLKGGINMNMMYRFRKNGFSVYKTQDKFTERNYTGYTTPVYQIYNADGKRVFASTSFTETMRKFKYLTEFLYNEI